MDQPGNNHVLLHAHQVTPPGGAANDRMRELLTRTAADHVADEWFAADVVEALRRRLETVERQVENLLRDREMAREMAREIAREIAREAEAPGQSLAGIAATVDGLAATLGSLEHKTGALDTRLERLDERLDDQYDRVTSLDGRLSAADAKLDALSGQFEEARADMSGRLGSLEEMVFTLAEVLLRPAARLPHALENRPRP